MIRLTIKHKHSNIAEESAKLIASRLQAKLGNRIIGPSTPGISRLRGMYIQLVTIKMEKKKELVNKIKELVKEVKSEVTQLEGKKSLRIIIDVDP